jgi:DNA-directed RNA polymerase subunit K/omega
VVGGRAEARMTPRPPGFNPFEFVILSSLRAAQLMQGCRPRVDPSEKAIVTAQREVAEGKVRRTPVAAAD